MLNWFGLVWFLVLTLVLFPDETAVRAQLQALRDEGFDSLAVVLMHSYTYPGEL